MRDTEVLESIGGTSEARIVGSVRTMLENGARESDISRVVVDQLIQAHGAATVDGQALAVRQLREMGIDVAGNYVQPLSRGDRVQAAKKLRERYSKAVATILSDGMTDQAIMRTGRLALAESMDAARAEAAELMKGQRRVAGWTRQLDSDPCELCTWWARDGRVWPALHTMPTHKGCACAQSWVRVASASIRSLSTRGTTASEQRSAAGTLAERRQMTEGAYSTRSTRGGTDGDQG